MFTFGLDFLTVGRDDHALNFVQLHVLGDLSETHDQAAFGLCLGRILLVDSLLEANQFLQEESHALVDLLAQHLVTVPAKGTDTLEDTGRTVCRTNRKCSHSLK